MGIFDFLKGGGGTGVSRYDHSLFDSELWFTNHVLARHGLGPVSENTLRGWFERPPASFPAETDWNHGNSIFGRNYVLDRASRFIAFMADPRVPETLKPDADLGLPKSVAATELFLKKLSELARSVSKADGIEFSPGRYPEDSVFEVDGARLSAAIRIVDHATVGSIERIRVLCLIRCGDLSAKGAAVDELYERANHANLNCAASKGAGRYCVSLSRELGAVAGFTMDVDFVPEKPGQACESVLDVFFEALATSGVFKRSVFSVGCEKAEPAKNSEREPVRISAQSLKAVVEKLRMKTMGSPDGDASSAATAVVGNRTGIKTVASQTGQGIQWKAGNLMVTVFCYPEEKSAGFALYSAKKDALAAAMELNNQLLEAPKFIEMSSRACMTGCWYVEADKRHEGMYCVYYGQKNIRAEMPCASDYFHAAVAFAERTALRTFRLTDARSTASFRATFEYPGEYGVWFGSTFGPRFSRRRYRQESDCDPREVARLDDVVARARSAFKAGNYSEASSLAECSSKICDSLNIRGRMDGDIRNYYSAFSIASSGNAESAVAVLDRVRGKLRLAATTKAGVLLRSAGRQAEAEGAGDMAAAMLWL